MKAKFINDVLFEKFTEDSDPVEDMGIGRTRYRTFKILGNESNFKLLQYLKKSKTIFGKTFEKWENIPLPLTPEQKRDKLDKNKSEQKYFSKYYVTNLKSIDHYYDDSIIKNFIKKWPVISKYFKYFKEQEASFIEDERKEIQRREDSRYEYFD